MFAIEAAGRRFIDMRIKIAAISCALLLAVAPLRAQVDAEQVMNIGRNVLSMDDYMLAIQYFNQAIKAKPYLAEPYYLRAYAKMELEDWEGAEEDCTLSIERNKFMTETYKLRGYTRQFLGKDSLAVEDYNYGLRYNPQDRAFLFYKAVAETELKRYAEADSTFAALLRLYPRYEEGYTARGRLNLLRGDTIAAIDDINRASGISSTALQPNLLMADIEVKRHNWNEALAAMDRAIILKPHEANFYLNRAFIRYNLDDYFGAMADYNYTLELEPFNTGALFNRALLRYEVKDLDRAAADFKEVLRLDPSNFHAAYNLGLVELERGRYKDAIARFETIAARYPKFYPVYYAIADAQLKSGNNRAAMQNVYHAESLVKAYIKDPKKNALERPAIQAGTFNDADSRHEDETEEEVMDRFNQLVMSGRASDTQLSYNEKIKGRVQDRDMGVETEPAYYISFIDTPESLKSTSNYFRSLDDFNGKAYIGNKLYLTPAADLSVENYEMLFHLASSLQETTDRSKRAADWLALGVARVMLKDNEAAVKALGKAIELYPDFALAYFERGYAHQLSGDPREMTLAISDYDAALRLDPNLAYAWFNKGNMYFASGDFTSALDSYGHAIEKDPAFATAYYNRGLTYLRLGNKAQAFSDLSKAGELGVLPSYNLLKRMK